MKLKGFVDKSISLIMNIMVNGKVCVKVNNELGPYFTTYKGMMQGGPLSRLLFNIGVDTLAYLVHKGRGLGSLEV